MKIRPDDPELRSARNFPMLKDCGYNYEGQWKNPGLKTCLSEGE
jgi:hypothetical protein